MKIYVASAFSNIPEVEEVVALLEAIGHKITHDWTKERCLDEWTEEEKVDYLAKCGAADARAVRACEVLVLVNHEDSRDSMAEFGMAFGMGKQIVVFHPERRGSVFFHEPGVHLAATMPELLALLTSLARAAI
jgi:hypothetical protein